MQSLLVKYLEIQIKLHRYEHLDSIFVCLQQEMIPNTGNYFDELVEIAKISKPLYRYCYHYKFFVEALKEKIIEQRGELDGEALIKKFS